MKNVNNFQIAKVQLQGFVYLDKSLVRGRGHFLQFQAKQVTS